MRQEGCISDVTVVGGGLAGVCAAIAAARLGAKVALINNRPVLGGNSSSEVRVWVVGATAHGRQRFARETGIMGELFVENQYRNAEGNPYYWDQVVLDAVRAEDNITLYLNTDVREVDAYGEASARRIRSVVGWTMGSERLTRFESPLFVDCTGDGLVGDLAGARYRIGREARAEYGEQWAPEEADEELLGSTILFYTKDAGRAERFVPPSITKDISKTPIPENRIISTGVNGCAYWWIEYGGHLDTVGDNEQIRDELWAVIFGIWDYIKNSGRFDADNLTLEWVGAVPGKREYRRLLGDYVLTQQDIVQQRDFEDAVAFGGWSIDLHPVEGVYAKEPGSKHLHPQGVYVIPFRVLYSYNVSNLLMAGRNISASHVAFGSTRVMATCAVLGEAAGTAAALCSSRQFSPRELFATRARELQQVLLKQDASVIGVRTEDPDDLAWRADVVASSTLVTLGQEEAEELFSISERDVALVIPVAPRIDHLEVLVDATRDTSAVFEMWAPRLGQNYVPEEFIERSVVPIGQGVRQWVKVPLAYRPKEECNAIVVVRRNADLGLWVGQRRVYGVLALVGPVGSDGGTLAGGEGIIDWDVRPLRRRSFAFRVEPESTAFEARRVTDGYQRPFGGPHLWCSGEIHEEKGEFVELSWSVPVDVGELRIVFNDDVDEDLINLHHHRTEFECVPELVRDYRVDVKGEGGWVTVVAVQGNRRRHRVHRLAGCAGVNRLRVFVTATHGCEYAQVIAVKVYEA